MSQNLLNPNPLNILITRPSGRAEPLMQALMPFAQHLTHQPLLSIQPLAHSVDALAHADIIIFISVNAVQLLNEEAFSMIDDRCELMAVGEKTTAQLQAIAGSVVYPADQRSEGLLALPNLSNIKHKRIVIIRGQGGRELLADALTERGAEISYLEVYKREPVILSHQFWYDQWQKEQINCIVVTSVEIADSVIQQMPAKWLSRLQNVIWLVASERIKTFVVNQHIPATNVINCNGAGDLAITEQVKLIVENGI